MKFAILMKPTSLAKKASRICAEYRVDVNASDKAEAIIEARKAAETDGRRGYAITEVREIQ